MCKYCDGTFNKSRFPSTSWVHVDISAKDNTLDFSYEGEDMEYEIAIKINYCPMCGRKLKEEK